MLGDFAWGHMLNKWLVSKGFDSSWSVSKTRALHKVIVFAIENEAKQIVLWLHCWLEDIGKVIQQNPYHRFTITAFYIWENKTEQNKTKASNSLEKRRSPDPCIMFAEQHYMRGVSCSLCCLGKHPWTVCLQFWSSLYVFFSYLQTTVIFLTTLLYLFLSLSSVILPSLESRLKFSDKYCCLGYLTEYFRSQFSESFLMKPFIKCKRELRQNNLKN